MINSFISDNKEEINFIISTAIKEDVGRGDLTSNILIDDDYEVEFVIKTREQIVVCGIDIVMLIFSELTYGNITARKFYNDGDKVENGEVLISGKGKAIEILAVERTALNIFQHMSAISTLTDKYVQAIVGTKSVILDTRKTLPLLKVLQKYAVKIGGGRNHRFRLDDGILIKDNHINIVGSVELAVKKARQHRPYLYMIEVECESLDQVEEALAAKADMIMLDNMSIADMAKAVAMAAGKVPIEASGGIRLDNVRAVAETGVDFISIGRLTHSATASDIGLDIIE